MEQKFEGPPPQAEIHMNGEKVIRTDVKGDWGMQLLWKFSREGQEPITRPARADYACDLTELAPGKYEIVLQTWHYKDYRKNRETREFLNSKFIDISNKLTHTVAGLPDPGPPEPVEEG